mmetsp:Transcript_37288/g.87506  ORF Transcript_37288/g.87506 Transcript_37288/m.87506 type:complete len:214 (+) Transcript_37288:21-662(+)
MKFVQGLPLIFQLFRSFALEDFQELSQDDECSDHEACSLHVLQLQRGTSDQDLKDADDLYVLKDFRDDAEAGGDCRRRRWGGDCDTRRRHLPPTSTTPSPPSQQDTYVLKPLGQNYCHPDNKVWSQNECRNAARYFQQKLGKPLQNLAVFPGPNEDVEASWGWVPVSCSLQTGWHYWPLGTNTVRHGSYQGHFKSNGKNHPLETLYQLICRKK